MKQKAICPFCKKDSETLHTFEVETGEEFSYCPTCGKKLKTSDAIETFTSTIRQMVRRANYQVHIAGKFEKAYRNFGDILTLQPENSFALTGRALSLMLMSTLRNERFEDAHMLVIFAREELRKQRNQITYFEFLARTETILKIYIQSCYEKLTYKEHFFDQDCISLFFSRIVLINDLLNLVHHELDCLILKGLTNSRVSEKLEDCHILIEGLSKTLNSSLATIEGTSYKCEVNKDKTVKLIKDNDHIVSKVEPKIIFSLNEKEHKHKLIPDIIFKARRGKFIISTFLMAGAWIFALLGILLITLGFTIQGNTLAMFISGVVLLGLSIIGFIIRIILKRKLKKTRLLNIAFDF